MYGRTAFIAGAALTLVASASLAQQPSTAANPSGAPSNSDGLQSGRPQAAISQDEVRQELKQAGFDNIEFLQSAYVVRATDKNGTKLVMTITPESVRAIAVAPNQPSGSAGQGSIAGAPNSGTGISGQAGNKNGPAASSSGTQANSQNSQHNEATREQDSAKIPGKSGGKSGPAVTPPSGTPQQ